MNYTVYVTKDGDVFPFGYSLWSSRNKYFLCKNLYKFSFFIKNRIFTLSGEATVHSRGMEYWAMKMKLS